MTANHEHTPTTQDVQWAAITTTFEDSSITEDAFNRWLDARDARIEAAAEQRGAERGWDEGCSAGLDAGLTIGEISMGLSNRRIPAPPENPYRADRLEGDDG